MNIFSVNPIASKDIQADRLKVCLSCVHRGSILGISKCNICSCPIRSKIALKASTCPKDKWPA